MTESNRSTLRSIPSVAPARGRRRTFFAGTGAALVVSMLLAACFLPARQPPGKVPDPCLEVPGPWCHEAGLTCDCRQQPPGDKCPSWLACSSIPAPPPPTPEPPRCTLGTPTATSLLLAGKRVDIKPEIQGANVSATPRGEFGVDYYCGPDMNWPEACAARKSFGPVAPDGHPQRMACEAQFLGQPCPTFSMGTCGDTPEYCPVTFDPFYVVDGQNQNHPVNVAAGCNGDDWEKVDGHVVRGMFWLATAHGRGTIQACNKGATVCTESRFQVDH